MKSKLNPGLYWAPRGLSFFMVFFWQALLYTHELGVYLVAGVMAWTFLLASTVLSWKKSLYGGVSFPVLGIIFLIFLQPTFSTTLTVITSISFFLIGALFLTDYFQKKK